MWPLTLAGLAGPAVARNARPVYAARTARPVYAARTARPVQVARRVRALAVALLLPLLALAAGPPARAQDISLLRDAEIERDLRIMAEPLLEAAGLDPEAVDLVLVNDANLNAFVAGGQNIFLHSGLILRTRDPGELLGVIAHEAGHISGGHLVRFRDEVSSATTQAILAALIGLAAAAATGEGDAAAGALAGAQSIAQANILSFSRTQESAADQAGLSFLERAGMSGRGLQRFFEELAGQEYLPAARQSRYVRTHPLTTERIETVRAAVARAQHADAPLPPAWIEMHRRMKAKLQGYLNPGVAVREYADDPSFAGRYALAFAHYRRNEVAEALGLIEGLIAEEPDNPFLHELKGQILMESGRAAEALAPWREAARLAPEEGLILMGAGHALVAANDDSVLPEAVRLLVAAEREEPRIPFIHRMLATAYGRMGDDGSARVHLAEEAFLRGNQPLAHRQAGHALRLLPPGSQGALRAQDILQALDAAGFDPDDPPQRPNGRRG